MRAIKGRKKEKAFIRSCQAPRAHNFRYTDIHRKQAMALNMPQMLAEKILARVPDAAGLYNRLLLVVAPSGAGKTPALREVAARTGYPLINLNLELSRLMLELTERQRTLQVPTLLDEIVQAHPGEGIILDNIEILFDIRLKQDPLRCLQRLSRNRTIIAAWNGTCAAAARGQPMLVYAEPDHPEYRRYPAGDLLVVITPSPDCLGVF
jgi:hypothetical protein